MLLAILPVLQVAQLCLPALKGGLLLHEVLTTSKIAAAFVPKSGWGERGELRG